MPSMPSEVWKTRDGRTPKEDVLTAFCEKRVEFGGRSAQDTAKEALAAFFYDYKSLAGDILPKKMFDFITRHCSIVQPRFLPRHCTEEEARKQLGFSSVVMFERTGTYGFHVSLVESYLQWSMSQLCPQFCLNHYVGACKFLQKTKENP